MNQDTNQNGNQTRRPTFKTGLHRPQWITRKAKQVVVLVRDASLSMFGEKARAAEQASRALVDELASPANKDGFFVAVADFGEHAKLVDACTPATDLAGRVSALEADGRRTNITAGIEQAFGVLHSKPKAKDSQSEWEFLRPVVIVFSDGGHNEGTAPTDAASRVRTEADLVTVAFGADADEHLLRSLATSPEHFYRCKDGSELRRFLAQVGATMTATMATRSNATQALASLKSQ